MKANRSQSVRLSRSDLSRGVVLWSNSHCNSGNKIFGKWLTFYTYFPNNSSKSSTGSKSSVPQTPQKVVNVLSYNTLLLYFVLQRVGSSLPPSSLLDRVSLYNHFFSLVLKGSSKIPQMFPKRSSKSSRLQVL